MNGRSEGGRGPRRRGARVAAGVSGIAMLAAGCGGGSPAASAAGSTYYPKAVAYAQCMRTHGVLNFPDPNSQGSFPQFQIDMSRQTAQSAQNACRHLQSGSGGQGTAQQIQAKLNHGLDFARCMRAHGVPGFPDPSTHNGGLGFNLSGVDTHAPQYQSANRTCQSRSGRGQPSAGATP